ncbi:MAG TPA: S16 family serine protease [Microthrixaceae bacterium]|nr:S16 family serine protease [Microthrixaceae bacterium]
MTDITDDSVPAGEPNGPGPVAEEQSARRRRRRWPYVVLAGVVAMVAAALFVPTPFYLYEPGGIRPTESRISISDHQAFSDGGTIDYPTVGIRQATVVGLFEGWADDAIEVRSKDEVYPGGDVKQERILNRRMMDDSKFIATVLAFDQVGYPVTVTGSGAFIDELMTGFPSSSILRQGDVITAVDGRPVTTAGDLRPLLEGKAAGDVVELSIRRPGTDGGEPVELTERVELGRNPDDDSRGYLGVAVSTADQGLDLPFDIDIDSGKVTGPSAGLAWTLGLVDRLTPGDLTGGRRVVATGEVATDGSVLTIGGIEQKMSAIVRGGYDVFLYPESTPKESVEAIEAIAGDRVELHPVGTIDEALAVLAPSGVPAAPPLS